MNELYLERERAKKLQELGIDCGEADLYVWKGVRVTDGTTLVDYSGDGDVFSAPMIKDVHDYKTYRLDKLLLALPEWCFELDMNQICEKFRPRNCRGINLTSPLEIEQLLEVAKSRGQAALNACADLLILLKENELL